MPTEIVILEEIHSHEMNPGEDLILYLRESIDQSIINPNWTIKIINDYDRGLVIQTNHKNPIIEELDF